MNKIKCITFDPAAQDALPDHINAKMKADRDNARLMADIENKAREYSVSKTCAQYYCHKRHYITCKEHGTGCEKANDYYKAFTAGAESRQSEIDLLKSDIVKYRAELKTMKDSEFLWHKVLCDKKKEVEELQEKVVSLQHKIRAMEENLN